MIDNLNSALQCRCAISQSARRRVPQGQAHLLMKVMLLLLRSCDTTPSRHLLPKRFLQQQKFAALAVIKASQTAAVRTTVTG